jgi:hypothetical protein
METCFWSCRGLGAGGLIYELYITGGAAGVEPDSMFITSISTPPIFAAKKL